MISEKGICPKCKKAIVCNFEKNDLIENQREERGMGFSIEYTLSHPIQCPYCGADLDVEVFEYPDNDFSVDLAEL